MKPGMQFMEIRPIGVIWRCLEHLQTDSLDFEIC